MGAERFKLSSINPNDQAGGGGCLCSERKCEDQAGPFVVFYANETADPMSPHVVLCSSCLPAINREVESGEVLALGTENPTAGQDLTQPVESLSYFKTGTAPSVIDDEDLVL